METARVAAVVARKDAAGGVDLDAKRVSAAFGEDFVSLCLGMIAPNQLSDRMDRFVDSARALDVASDGATLGAVKPTVRPPA
jgi:hypothetical protein